VCTPQLTAAQDMQAEVDGRRRVDTGLADQARLQKVHVRRGRRSLTLRLFASTLKFVGLKLHEPVKESKFPQLFIRGCDDKLSNQRY
jgi:hypothetical protein